MKDWKKRIAFTALIAGILTVSIPLATAAHKKLTKEAKFHGVNTSQLMIDAKDLPTLYVAEPY